MSPCPSIYSANCPHLKCRLEIHQPCFLHVYQEAVLTDLLSKVGLRRGVIHTYSPFRVFGSLLIPEGYICNLVYFLPLQQLGHGKGSAAER